LVVTLGRGGTRVDQQPGQE